MAKMKLVPVLMGIAWALALLGVAELFLSGQFLSGMILGLFPEIVHTIVGWTLVALGVLRLLEAFNVRLLK